MCQNLTGTGTLILGQIPTRIRTLILNSKVPPGGQKSEVQVRTKSFFFSPSCVMENGNKKIKRKQYSKHRCDVMVCAVYSTVGTCTARHTAAEHWLCLLSHRWNNISFSAKKLLLLLLNKEYHGKLMNSHENEKIPSVNARS